MSDIANAIRTDLFLQVLNIKLLTKKETKEIIFPVLGH